MRTLYASLSEPDFKVDSITLPCDGFNAEKKKHLGIHIKFFRLCFDCARFVKRLLYRSLFRLSKNGRG